MPALNILIRQVNLSCYESGNGFASVYIRGGSAPYEISWVNDGTGEEISTRISARGLSAGNYTVTVTDSDGTVVSDTATLTQPSYEAPIDELGMSLCQLRNCFLPLASCKAGQLGYKYIYTLPSEAIDCEAKQQEIIWLNNAIDILSFWMPEGTVIENGITATLELQMPQMTCSLGGSAMTITANIVSSVDGEIATFPSTVTTTTTFNINDIYDYFNSVINNIPSNAFTIGAGLQQGTFTIRACGSRYNGSTITLNITISNMPNCTINPAIGWTILPNGGTYTMEDATAVTCETDEPCLTNEEAGILVERIKEMIPECNISELISDTI